MKPTEIIRTNLSAFSVCYGYVNTNYPQSPSNVLEHIKRFVGWGQCRKLIDPSSEEYRILAAYRILGDNLKFIDDRPELYARIIRDVQSATLTSYYTPALVAESIRTSVSYMYSCLNGVPAQTLLEPSAGNGAFLRGLERNVVEDYTQIETCEADFISRTILHARVKAMHEINPDIHYSEPLDRFEHLNHSSYDVIVSNIPFGKIAVADPSFAKRGDAYRLACKSIHNYYFLRSIHCLNEGGILAFITTRGFLSSESNEPIVTEMMRHGRFISMLRLPDNLFDSVDVGSDLVIYQKTSTCPDILTYPYGWSSVCASEQMPMDTIDGVIITDSKNQYGAPVKRYTYDASGLPFERSLAADIKVKLNKELTKLMNSIPATAPSASVTVPSVFPEGSSSAPRAKSPSSSPSPSVAPELPGIPESPSSPSLFSLFAGIPSQSRIVNICLAIMKRMYDSLSDDTRPFFLDAYNSLTSVISHNTGSAMSIHDIVASYSTTIPDSLSKFALSLEKKSGGKWVPADIFHSASRDGLDTNLSPDNALAASLNMFGRVDMPFIQTATLVSRDQLLNDLHGKIYFNPISGEFEEADRFLCGNVVERAKQCREHIDIYRDGERLLAEQSISALESARPVDIPFNDINVQLGVRWIPTKYYEDFIYWIFDKTREDYPCDVEIQYSAPTDDFIGNIWFWGHPEWIVGNNRSDDMIFAALRGACPNFTKKENGTYVKDEEKIQKGIKVIQEIKRKWEEFCNLPQSAPMRKDIQRIYNERFNCEVRPSYDGSFQSFPDLHLENLDIEALYPSQKDAIWMIKRNGGGVCWHEVGTGKTLIMCVSAYEMKRIGLIKKPIIIGLKANIAQIADTFRKAYPDAKVLFPGPKDFSKTGRSELFDQIKNNDWDCIIMTHEQFGQIPAAEITEMRLMEEEIASLDDAIRDFSEGSRYAGRALRGLQQRRDNLRTKLTNMRQEIASRKDKVLDFSEMGIDHIFVDESHYFKNLAFTTRNERVAGIGNPVGSQRAWKLLTAIRDIQHRTGRDLGATFCSGTIVSNSLTELYIIFKYLRPRALAEQNIHSFDAWATIFCERSADFELNIVNQIQTKERFSAYVNLPELSRFLSQITDYRTSLMCGIDAPTIEQHFESAPPTQQQEEMLNNLTKFVRSGHWHDLGIQRDCPPNLDKSLMLVATNIARQVSLDPRIVDDCRSYGDEDNNKVRRCADNIMKVYNKTQQHLGTQFVFTDISTLDPDKWNMQQALRDILVNERGVPSSEVAFINDATTDNKRLDLFRRMNEGKVRVLIGSTQKLGTGVNAQQRAVAVHHLDIPWRPSDLEQRNGRAVRKGNEVKIWNDNKVEVFIYATERTLDSYKFSLLRNKQTFIDQLNKGTLGVRRIDDSLIADGDKAVSYAEFLSIVSGNTDLLEKAKLDARIMALERDKTSFYRERNQALNDADHMEEEIKQMKQWNTLASADLKHPISDDDVLRINDRASECTDHRSAGKVIWNMIDSYMNPVLTTVGQVGRFKISAERLPSVSTSCNGPIKFYLEGPSGQLYMCCQNGNMTGTPIRSTYENTAHFPHDTFSHIRIQIELNLARIKEYTEKIPVLRAYETKKWSGDNELTDAYAKLYDLTARINASNPSTSPSTPDAA